MKDWSEFPVMSRKCDYCGTANSGQTFWAYERMLGTGKKFELWRCSLCKSVILLDPPSDMSQYYPPSYYSFRQKHQGDFLGRKLLVSALSRGLARRANMTMLSGLLCQSQLVVLAEFVLESRVDPEKSSLVDVGSGSGDLLTYASALRFQSLTGLDAFIPSDILRSDGVAVKRGTLKEVTGEKDLIMFNHSFEHFENPLGTLREVHRILSPKGLCMIRVPVAGSQASEYYKSDWVQLDVPRHLTIPSERGLRECARAAGLELLKVWYDSGPFQFKGSNQNARRSVESEGSESSRTELKEYGPKMFDIGYRIMAAKLNNRKAGDQAAFIFRAANH